MVFGELTDILNAFPKMLNAIHKRLFNDFIKNIAVKKIQIGT